MATLEQLKTHISATKTKLEEAQKKAGEAKYDPDVRKIQKKYKRLTRKGGKIVYMEKKKEEKAKKKKAAGNSFPALFFVSFPVPIMSSDSFDFDIEKIALLARLKLTEEEQARLGRQFEGILQHIDQLNQLDTENVEPTSHVLPLQNVFREDKVKTIFKDGQYLPLAPKQDKDHYEVPQII